MLWETLFHINLMLTGFVKTSNLALILATKMPNIFFEAKSLWEAGERERGFLLLNDYLENQLKHPVFQDASLLYKEPPFGKPRDFYTEVYLLITAYRLPDVSFCSLFPLIWQLNPHQRWINALLEADLYSEFYFEESEKRLNRQVELEIIADVLLKAAFKGLLGSDLNEEPFIRRAVLPIERIEEINDWTWGILKSILLERLPEAYANCPLNFWVQLAKTELEEFVSRFLQDVFLDLPIETAALRWKVIVCYRSSYADTVKNSIEKLLADNHNFDWLTEMVRVDAGITSVSNGFVWLKALSLALQQENFSSLLQA